MHDVPLLRRPSGLRSRADEHAVGREKVLDFARHLDVPVRDEHEVVGDPLQFGQDV